MHKSRAAAIIGILLISLSLGAQPVRRVALVVGNAAYRNVPALSNPKNDAEGMAAALTGLGFEVIKVLDGSNAAMNEAIVEFSRKLQGAEAGLFYYAGHGVQSQGSNYLLPVDADIKEEYQLRFLALDAALVLEAMSASGSALNLVILDACRDNPWKDSGRSMAGGRGLAVVQNAPQGAIIVYATDPGKIAQDGAGRNGTFTEALLRHIGTPGIDIKAMFDRVGAEVSRSTGGAQNPWISSKFYGSFYLKSPPAAASSVPPPLAPPLQAPSTQTPPTSTPFPAAPSPTTQAGQAELFVSADREGAEVWINGRKAGLAGSVIGALPAEIDLLVEARSGFWAASTSLRLKAGETRELVLRLAPLKANILFQVPNPSAFTLIIDGRSLGGLGSGLVKGLDAGSHEAELRGDGLYWKGPVEAHPSRTETVKAQPWEVGGLRLDAPGETEARLERVLPPGSTEASSELRLRGGASLETLPVGEYRLSAAGPGYEAATTSLRVEKGRETRWAPWTTGGLLVTTDPPGLDILVNGLSRGKSPLRLSGLAPGAVSLVVDHPDWMRLEGTAIIEPGKTASVSWTMRARSAPPPASKPAPTARALPSPGAGRNVMLQLFAPTGADYSLSPADQALFDRFEQANPTIGFIRMGAPDQAYEALIKAMFAGGFPPELLALDDSDRYGALRASGLVWSLDAVLPKDRLKNMLPAVADPERRTGAPLDFLPSGASFPSVLYVNLKALERCGLAPPRSYEELRQMVPVLKAKGIKPLVISAKDRWPLSTSLLTLAVGRYCGGRFWEDVQAGKARFTDKGFLEALAFIKSLFADGVIDRETAFQLDYLKTQDLFLEGKAAFLLDGDWIIGPSNFPRDPSGAIKFMSFPRLPNEGFPKINPVLLGKGFALAKKTARGSPQFRAAQGFFSHASSPEVQLRRWEEQGIAPILKGLKSARVSPSSSAMNDYRNSVTASCSSPGTVFDESVVRELNQGLYELCLGAGAMTPQGFAERFQKAVEASRAPRR